MRKKSLIQQCLAVCLIMVISIPPFTFAQDTQGAPVFKQEELDQILAPIALYPDSLLSQIFMASTYPLEVVTAARWAEQNKDLQGDALAAALEEQSWDPSVKSLINFPQVLDMMNEKLDWTQKLGDAFLAQQKDVMDTVQNLRLKAQEAGNLQTTQEQVVKAEEQTIIIESASPEVVYVPVYDPVVVYGTWWYPYYPPYCYYPPGYVAGAAAFSFAAGVAVGVAWGYAWGGCNWHNGNVDIDINKNINVNHNINRSQYAKQYDKNGKFGQGGQGTWQHDPSHRNGVSYRDQGTAMKYNRASTTDAAKSREDFRGRADADRQDLSRGSADQLKSRQNFSENRGAQSRGNTFEGIDRGGSSTRQFSDRGQASRSSMSQGRAGFSGGGRSGGHR
ncbi:MAG: DUF3300 domain-containing protein [Candidatus Omnitrophica bacterium]|nr:DUF3300 domain-containing protein [Candidatus Omnitrophota bacterium]